MSHVLAHGFGGRLDLPVPRGLFVFGAATALIVSFVALAALWREPKLEGREAGRGRAGPLQALLSSQAVEWTVRLASLALFLVVMAAAFRPVLATQTIAPVFVFVWFWVGLAFAHALLGNLWATLSPWDTIGRLAMLDYPQSRPPLEYPKAWGRWPAAILLFGFVWLELAEPIADNPNILGIAIFGYTAVTITGMLLFGRAAWTQNGEAFAVYFGLLSMLSPLARDEDGRVVVRPPLSGLTTMEPRPGLVGVVVVALGSTTFDGFTRTSAWLGWSARFRGTALVGVTTAAMLAVIMVVATVYALAMAAAARVTGGGWHALSVRFAHSLVPIAFAYVVAHYFSLLLIEGQIGLSRLSDPFGWGWNLFGTAGWRVNLALLSATLIWYVQVAAIVLGHIAGVVLAHDRAIALFENGRAVRTQYALLAVMVLFSAVGLLILSGG